MGLLNSLSSISTMSEVRKIRQKMKQSIYSERYIHVSAPLGTGVSLVMYMRASFGLTHFTSGSISKRAIVLLSGIGFLSVSVRSCAETKESLVEGTYLPILSSHMCICTPYIPVARAE